jgi:hypothetical protein
MCEMVNSLNIAVDAPLLPHLVPLDMASQLLGSSLHTNSQYETSLRDPSEEKSLSGLEGELVRLQNGVQKLDLDVLHRRDNLQEQFIERWS